MAEEKNIKEQAPETVGAAEEAKAAEAMKAEGEAAQDVKERKKSRKEEKKGEQLEKQVEELTDKLAKEKDSYLRLMAEFETFRRRAAEERLNLVASAAADTVKGMLPVLDDCERAMEMLADSSDEAAKEGTSLIYNKLMEYLKSLGLERIEAKCFRENAVSARALRAAGMRPCGEDATYFYFYKTAAM